MTPRILANTRAFLDSAQLTGAQVPAYVEARRALDALEPGAVPWPVMADLLRSGQVPDEAVPGIVERLGPDFARWFSGTSPT